VLKKLYGNIKEMDKKNKKNPKKQCDRKINKKVKGLQKSILASFWE